MAAIPSHHARCSSVCLSVCPHLATSSSPAAGCVQRLPVKSISLSCEELMAVLSNGKDAIRSPAHASPALEAGSAGRERRQGEQAERESRQGAQAERESRLGEPRLPHKETDSGLDSRAQTSSKLPLFSTRLQRQQEHDDFPTSSQHARCHPAWPTPRTQQLNGFRLLPLHLIFARVQIANCSPAAWLTSVLLNKL